MLNEEIRIGAHVAIYKELPTSETLSIYGEVSALRRHWDGNPDHLEIQVSGLGEWISLHDAQVTVTKEELIENDCA